MLRTEDMHQDATYWSPGINDGFGLISYGAPSLIKCRWQNQNTLFRDAHGREVTSEAVVYVASEVLLRGKIALGDFTRDSGAEKGTSSPVDPSSIAGAREIRGIARSPSLSADEELLKVFL